MSILKISKLGHPILNIKAKKVENILKSKFKNKLLKTKISRNIRLAEAPDDGKPAIMYDVDCAGAKNYMELALEILNEKK